MRRQSFHCRHGKAYLFSRVVNVSVGPREDRLMTTGLHTVSDINCNVCLQVVGWRYVRVPPFRVPCAPGKALGCLSPPNVGGVLLDSEC